MKNLMRSPAGGVLVALLAAAPLHAQGFGASVATTGDALFIGESLNETQPGYVYVYVHDDQGEWTRLQKLVASDAQDGDHFGRALAAQDNTLIVGATVHRNLAGAAYVFERDLSSGEWVERQLLETDDGVEEDAFGRTADMDGGWAFISDWANTGSRGAVYVFYRDADSGEWTQHTKLMASDPAENAWFGWGVDVEGDRAVIGSPFHSGQSGVAYVFGYDEASDTWTEEARLVADSLGPNSRFGQDVALNGDRLHVAAPGHNQFAGAVFTFERDEATGEWRQTGTVGADAQGGVFGAGLARVDDELWIGAPGSFVTGRVFRAPEDALDSSNLTALPAELVRAGDAIGDPFAVAGDVAVFGLTGADYNLGAALVYERDGMGQWTESGRLMGDDMLALDAITGEKVECSEGTASLWDCQDVDILSFLPVQSIGGSRGVQVNDLWGWTDPETGREYALVGRYDGTSFIDVSDPSNPMYLGDLPMTEGARGNSWRDIKVYRDHAFIVADGAGSHGMQVFDLTELRDVSGPPVTFETVAHYDGIHSTHNIVINEETGFAYAVGANSGGETCGGGLHMIDIRDPLNPTFAGCFQDITTGNNRTGYSHDAQCVDYQGPDEEHRGKEICFGSNETALSIADVTDKENPIALSAASYPNVAYAHQGWLDEEQRYFYMNDEGDEISGNVEFTRTLVWDVADLDDPVLAGEYLADNKSSDHNLYIKGNLMYQSNYVSGLRIVDISDRENPRQVGYFDTVPWGEDSPGFDGSWSNYPYFESGIIVVTSGREGVFVLQKQERRPVS